MQHYVLKMVGQPDIIATKTGVFSVKHVAYIMERRKIMISFILCLLLLTILFGIAYKITGAILKACVWLAHRPHPVGRGSDLLLYNHFNTGRDRNYQGRDPDDIAGVKK
mgnify:CR=1 FL=1